MPQTNIHRINNLALLTLLLLPSLLFAQDEPRWYQVELIIFAQNNPNYHTSEHWPQDYVLPDLEDSRTLAWPRGNGTTKPQPFTLVAQKDLKLGDAVKRIESASDVTLMLHLGWLQPGLEQKDAVAVHIYDGMLSASTESLASGTLPRLDGTLRLTLARYLHLESDLLWREPRPAGQEVDMPAITENTQGAVATNPDSVIMAEKAPADSDQQSGTGNYNLFRLQQSRRMRSSEIHYIDHPMFGIVALITPYEQMAAEKK